MPDRDRAAGRDRDEHDEWRAARRWLNRNRPALTRAAARLYPADWRVAGTRLLARPEWIPAAPVPLESVALDWRDEVEPAEVRGGETASEGIRPVGPDGTRYPGYTAALRALDPPRLLEDRVCYRLLSVEMAPARTPAREPSVTLTFGPGRYSGVLDIGEAVAHELAASTLTNGGVGTGTGGPRGEGGTAAYGPVGRRNRAADTPARAGDPAADAPIGGMAATDAPIGGMGTATDAPIGGMAATDAAAGRAGTATDGVSGGGPRHGPLPLRALVGDPRDPGRRAMVPAICTLVLRHDAATGTATFPLHQRDAGMVASGGGLLMVAPVGVFQPSADEPWNVGNDLDLWRATVRELAEELLGTAEDYGSDRAPIDYDGWPFFRELAAARADGSLRVHWLGLGVDPLTLAVDIMLVAVFDAELFDRLFAGLVAANEEGSLVTGCPFTAEEIDVLTGRRPMQPAGSALLRLAWAHRDTLLS